MNSLVERLDRWALWLSCAALLIMMLHVTFDVIGKYLFNHAMPLTIELVSSYYMVAVVLLPLASLERQGSSLIHVELLYEHLPSRLQRLTLPATQLLAALYCAAAGWAAWKPAMAHMRSGSYAGSQIVVATWPTYFLPVFGFALLALALLAKAIAAMRDGVAEETTEGTNSP